VRLRGTCIVGKTGFSDWSDVKKTGSILESLVNSGKVKILSTQRSKQNDLE